MERNYESTEQALSVAKEVVYLAWQACGGPQGMGVFQDLGPKQDRETVWEHAYGQRDYSLRHGGPERVSCEYVMGRMMKLDFKLSGDTIEHSESECRPDYQSWCHKYRTYAALFDAAEAAVKSQAAVAKTA